MKKNLTELVFIIDKSGSMCGLEKDTIGGYNSMLEQQLKVDGEYIITTVLFDNRYELLHNRTDIRAIRPITEKEYSVGGSTALLYAIGKTINKIIEDTGVKIDINDESMIFIASSDDAAIKKARTIIENIVRDVEVGDVYEGKVTKIMENDKGQFGASVNFAPGKDGMIHISKLSDQRVDKVTDVVNVGDIVLVKVIKIDEKHRVDLRLKEVLSKATN